MILPITVPITITHDPAAHRFQAQVEGLWAVCVYRRVDNVLHITHTEVPRALEGRGIAALLVQEALAWARSEGLHVHPACSYVAAYMRRHPQTQDLLWQPNQATKR